MGLSVAQRNASIYVTIYSKMFSYSNNINATHYDSFWSYDKTYYEMFYSEMQLTEGFHCNIVQ